MLKHIKATEFTLNKFENPLFSLKSTITRRETKKELDKTETWYIHTTHLEPYIGNTRVEIISEFETEEEVKNNWDDDRFELISVEQIYDESSGKKRVILNNLYKYRLTISAKPDLHVIDVRKSKTKFNEVYAAVFISIPPMLPKRNVAIKFNYSASGQYRNRAFMEGKAIIEDSIDQVKSFS